MHLPGERRQGDGPDPGAEGAAAAPAQGPEPTKPLFYQNPQPLQAAAHATKGLRQPGDYRFAARTHAVVLHAEEFRLAAAHYPIVFADDESAMPLAVLGLRDGQNLFVDEAGQWAPDTYVPAYVRRYPFVSGRGSKPDEVILYVDTASDLFVDLAEEPGAAPFFVDGEPSERTKQVLEFCAAFQQQVPATNAFVAAVKEHDLLTAKEIRLDLPAGGQQLLTGLRLIEETKFKALPDEVFLEWRRRGWVPLVYWHWASMDNVRRLLART